MTDILCKGEREPARSFRVFCFQRKVLSKRTALHSILQCD